MVDFSQVSVTIARSTLWLFSSKYNAEQASGLAKDLAFITIHVRIERLPGGPGLRTWILIELFKLRDGGLQGEFIDNRH